MSAKRAESEVTYKVRSYIPPDGDDWPTRPEKAPLYGRSHHGNRPLWWSSQMPAEPPYEMRWLWKWTECDGRRGQSDDWPPDHLVCDVVSDFACPIHEATS